MALPESRRGPNGLADIGAGASDGSDQIELLRKTSGD